MKKNIEFWLFTMLSIVWVTFMAFGAGGFFNSAHAAPAKPQVCTHIANADLMKIYYCEDIYLFVNDRGFMAFEP